MIAISFYFEKPIDSARPERIELKSQGGWLDEEQNFYKIRSFVKSIIQRARKTIQIINELKKCS